MAKIGVSKAVLTFKGGQVADAFYEWTKLTSDPYILSIIWGDKIEFTASPPTQHFANNATFSEQEKVIIRAEISKLLEKRVITRSKTEDKEFVSPIFITPKSDGGHRLILNLKKLNEFIKYEHFKMDSIKEVLLLVTQGCYMCKVDLKDAYYSIKVDPRFQKYLKCRLENILYQFVCFPNGLAPCPRKFTKIMKVPLATLRSLGHIVSGYIDDFFTCAAQYKKCEQSAMQMKCLFSRLGLVIHPDKSILTPTQEIEFLGFMINSKEMTVELTKKKNQFLKNY